MWIFSSRFRDCCPNLPSTCRSSCVVPFWWKLNIGNYYISIMPYSQLLTHLPLYTKGAGNVAAILVCYISNLVNNTFTRSGINAFAAQALLVHQPTGSSIDSLVSISGQLAHHSVHFSLYCCWREQRTTKSLGGNCSFAASSYIIVWVSVAAVRQQLDCCACVCVF